MKKRFFSIFLCVLILMTILGPVPVGFVREAEAVSKISESVVIERIKKLQKAFEGKYFTTTQESCGNSRCSKCNAGNVLKQAWVKKVIDLVPKSFSMTHYYYTGGQTNGWSCCGFANFAGWYIFAQKASDTVKYKQYATGAFNYNTMKKAKPGDIIRLGNAAKKGGSDSSGHSAIVVSVSSSGVKVFDCNFKHYNYVYTHTIGYTQYSKYKYVTISRATNYDTSTPAVTSTVTFDLNDDRGICLADTIKVTSGQTYGTLPTPTRSGYEFLGWYDAASGGNSVTSTTKVTKTTDHILYAHWNIIQTPVTVTFHPNGGSCSTGSASVNKGTAIGTLPTATYSGYSFDGWYTEPTGGTKLTTAYAPTADVTIYAHWSNLLKYTYNTSTALNKASDLLKSAQNSGAKGATYVSSVLRAGGLGNVKQSGAGDLIDYLNTPANFGGTIGQVIVNPKGSQLHPGDVLCVVCTKGGNADGSNGHSKGAGKYYGLQVMVVSQVLSDTMIRYYGYVGGNYTYGDRDLNLNTYKAECSTCGNSSNSKLIAFVFNDAAKKAGAPISPLAPANPTTPPSTPIVADPTTPPTTPVAADPTTPPTKPTVSSTPQTDTQPTTPTEAQPTYRTITIKKGKRLKLVATKIKKATYQWYYRTGSNASWYPVPGKAGRKNSCSIKATEAVNGYQYYCVTTSLTSVLKTEVVAIKVAIPTKIKKQPVWKSKVSMGERVTLSVTATGGRSYQWYYRPSSKSAWIAIQGATNPILSFTVNGNYQGYQYHCIVGSDLKPVTSKTVTLKMINP